MAQRKLLMVAKKIWKFSEKQLMKLWFIIRDKWHFPTMNFPKKLETFGHSISNYCCCFVLQDHDWLTKAKLWSRVEETAVFFKWQFPFQTILQHFICLNILIIFIKITGNIANSNGVFGQMFISHFFITDFILYTKMIVHRNCFL